MLKKSLFTLLICAAGLLAAHGQEQEADLKAVFIYNFTRYVEWDSIPEKKDFVIGVIGSSPVTTALRDIARAHTAKDRKLVIRVFARPEDIRNCDVLFISRNAGYPIHSVLDRVPRGVLTVSETPGGAAEGTAFNFVIVNDKLKFEANLKAIYSEGLKAGSQLLKLAILVD